MIKDTSKRANIPHTTPHTLRRCFATHLHDHKVSIFIIKALMGHEKIKTTEKYIRIGNEVL